MNAPTRLIALNGAHNVRDLGGYATTSGATTRWHAVLRGDAPHRLDADDRARLIAAGLTTVIDLRGPAERAAAPSIFAHDAAVAHHAIALFSALDPVQAFAAADPDGFDMGRRYCAALDRCQEGFARVLRTIANAPDGMILVHCTAGKDRTGLVVALLLAAAGVADADIIEDYALTGSLAPGLIAELRARALALGTEPGLAERVLASTPDNMARLLAHLADTHGGVGAYLDAVGLSAAERARLTARLV
jgi:protein-tyrosine phosphatase